MKNRTPRRTTSSATYRELHVRGRDYGGHDSRMVYELSTDQTINTLADAKQIAGDFDRITSAELVTVTTTVDAVSQEIRS